MLTLFDFLKFTIYSNALFSQTKMLYFLLVCQLTVNAGQHSNPLEKQKQIRVCTTYKLALQILLAKKTETDVKRNALLSAALADLVIHPKHKLICIRMAINNNLQANNFGIAARFIDILLPLNLVTFSFTETESLTFIESLV